MKAKCRRHTGPMMYVYGDRSEFLCWMSHRKCCLLIEYMLLNHMLHPTYTKIEAAKLNCVYNVYFVEHDIIIDIHKCDSGIRKVIPEGRFGQRAHHTEAVERSRGQASSSREVLGRARGRSKGHVAKVAAHHLNAVHRLVLLQTKQWRDRVKWCSKLEPSDNDQLLHHNLLTYWPVSPLLT